MTYVGDTVAGFIAAATRGAAVGRTIQLGTGTDVSVGELVDLVADILGRELPGRARREPRQAPGQRGRAADLDPAPGRRADGLDVPHEPARGPRAHDHLDRGEPRPLPDGRVRTLIPLFDIRIRPEEIEAVSETLRSGWLTMGPRTEQFESEFAEHLGAKHAVAVSSCTAALHLAYLAAGVGPGDEVIVPAITFVATAAAARYCGATPVPAEIRGQHDLGIDPDHVDALIGERTKAVCAVHFAGYPADMDRLRAICERRGVALIEDAAHAPTIAPGSLAACYSFFSNKVLSCGEGGLLATDDDERGRPGPQPSLARHDLGHLGAPPGPRLELRRGRARLQLPHRRAAGGAAVGPPARPGGRRGGPPQPRAPLPRAAGGRGRAHDPLRRRRGRPLLVLRHAGHGRRPGAPRAAARIPAGAGRPDQRPVSRVPRAEQPTRGPAGRSRAPSSPPAPSSRCRSTPTSPRPDQDQVVAALRAGLGELG